MEKGICQKCDSEGWLTEELCDSCFIKSGTEEEMKELKKKVEVEEQSIK